jgi:hypothetical protein
MKENKKQNILSPSRIQPVLSHDLFIEGMMLLSWLHIVLSRKSHTCSGMAAYPVLQSFRHFWMVLPAA